MTELYLISFFSIFRCAKTTIRELHDNINNNFILQECQAVPDHAVCARRNVMIEIVFIVLLNFALNAMIRNMLDRVRRRITHGNHIQQSRLEKSHYQSNDNNLSRALFIQFLLVIQIRNAIRLPKPKRFSATRIRLIIIWN